MSELKIGLQFWTMRGHSRSREETLATLARIKDMGYRAIQVQPDRRSLSLAEYGQAARELGLAICASHVSYDWILKETDKVIQAHLDAGCPIIGIGEMPEQFWGSATGFAEFARSCNQAARTIKASGLQLIYHNHQFEFLKYGGKLGMDILREEFDPAVDFELDTYWAQTGGADPMQWIRKLGGRLPIVHFKDMALDEKWVQVFAPVGEGNMNWPAIIDACRDAGTTWCVVEQDTCRGSAFDCVASSLHYLQGLGL